MGYYATGDSYYRAGDPGLFDFFADTGKKIFESASKTTGQNWTAGRSQFGLGNILQTAGSYAKFIPVVGTAIGTVADYAGQMIGNPSDGGGSGGGFTTMQPPWPGSREYTQLYSNAQPLYPGGGGYRSPPPPVTSFGRTQSMLSGSRGYGSNYSPPPQFGMDYSDISDDYEDNYDDGDY